jgi:hypothetical protein
MPVVLIVTEKTCVAKRIAEAVGQGNYKKVRLRPNNSD